MSHDVSLQRGEIGIPVARQRQEVLDERAIVGQHRSVPDESAQLRWSGHVEPEQAPYERTPAISIIWRRAGTSSFHWKSASRRRSGSTEPSMSVPPAHTVVSG